MEKFDVPEELMDLWDEAEAAKKARADATKCYFKFQLRNCIELGRIHESKTREFWLTLKDLYPEVDISKLVFNAQEGKCWEQE